MSSIQNRDRSLRAVATVGVLSALSVVLVALIHFPILPMVSYLEYDPADIPILLVTALFGPLYGLVMTLVVSIVQGLTVSAQSGWVGILMHILATGSLVLAFGLTFPRKSEKQTNLRILLPSFSGVAAMTVTMFFWNLLITPWYQHVPRDMVLAVMPFILLFNVLKASVNTGLAVFLYEVIRRVIRKN